MERPVVTILPYPVYLKWRSRVHADGRIPLCPSFSTLEGTVPAAVERELAEKVATLLGAREVRNRLEMHGVPLPEPTSPMATGALGRVTTPPGAPPSRRADLGETVRHALAEDRRVNEHLLEVQVENNSVFLTGRQGDVDARNAAIETAAHVPGVVGVVDDIEIMPAV